MDRWEKDNMRNAFVSRGSVGSHEATLIFPQTFMNNSGQCVKDLSGTEKIKDLVVIQDDIDLPFGAIRISKDRGTAGHNGIESIVSHLGTKDFARIRIGVTPIILDELKKPKGEDEIEKFVLGSFNQNERSEIENLSQKIADALTVTFDKGIEEAMNIYNQK